MINILKIKEAIEIAKKIRQHKKTIVLVGGCFDIIHIGHIKLISNAKKYGDFLFVLLESDKNVEEKKGEGRPINNQKDRAVILSSLKAVDFVILLPTITRNEQYDQIVKSIMPSFLATTTNDPNIEHKKRQAKKISAKIVYATKFIPDQSTTKFAKLIGNRTL